MCHIFSEETTEASVLIIENQLTHHIHPACIPSSLREHDPSSPSLERVRERETGRRREVNRWRDIETDRQKESVHACVWSHVHECVFDGCQEKKKSDNGYHTIC